MFYEARSEFFFDPRSKLYYGNRQQAYYRYNDTRQPPFEQVSGMGVGHAGQQSPKKVGDTHQEEEEGSHKEASPMLVPKMKVRIKLKTTSRPLTRKSPQEKDDDSAREKRDRPAPPSNHTQRQYAAKMEKWNTLKLSSSHKAMDSSSKKSSTFSMEQSVVIQKTSSKGGEPLCKLCLRKFRNLKHLHRHEAFSDLHKDNLKKASLTAKRPTGDEPKEESPAHDEDRANKKRRLLHEGKKKAL
jgi:hypothetical protein